MSQPPLWTLILQRTSPKPVAEIGRLLAYHLSLHPTDAIALVRYGGGLVAENLPDDMATRLIAQLDAIDEFHLTLAGHTLFGGAAAPTATGIPDGFLPRSCRLVLHHCEPRPGLGECFLSYRRDGASPPPQP